MAQLLISSIDEVLLQKLRERAFKHHRTAEAEAAHILKEALQAPSRDPWAVVDAIRNQLTASGREFGDSTELVREDRDR